MTPGRLILPVPSKDTPPIVLAFAKAVAVAALPVVDPEEPDTLPVTLPIKFPVEVVVPVIVTPALVVSNFLELLKNAVTAPPDKAVS